MIFTRISPALPLDIAHISTVLILMIFAALPIHAQENLEGKNKKDLEYNSQGMNIISMQSPWFRVDYLAPYSNEGRRSTDFHQESLTFGFNRFLSERANLGFGATVLNFGRGTGENRNATGLILEPQMGMAIPVPGRDIMLTAAFAMLVDFDSKETPISTAISGAISYPVLIQSRNWAWNARISATKTLVTNSSSVNADAIALNIGQEMVYSNSFDNGVNGNTEFNKGTIYINGASGLNVLRRRDQDVVTVFNNNNGFSKEGDGITWSIGLLFDGGYYMSRYLAFVLDLGLYTTDFGIKNLNDYTGGSEYRSSQIEFSGGLRVHPFANGFFFEGMTGSYVKKYQSKYEDSEPVKWEPTEFTYSIECGYALPIFPSIILTPSFSYVNQAPGFLSFGPRDYLYDRGVRLDLGLSAYLGRRG